MNNKVNKYDLIKIIKNLDNYDYFNIKIIFLNKNILIIKNKDNYFLEKSNKHKNYYNINDLIISIKMLISFLDNYEKIRISYYYYSYLYK